MAIVYTARDAQGVAYEIQAGLPFVTYWVSNQLDEVSHPWNALDVYSDADLARFGITRTTEPDPPAPIPQVISRMQAFLELHATASPTTPGKTLLDDVNAAVAAASDPTLGIYWATAADFHRDHPKLLALAAALSLSSATVDALFAAASQLS